MPDQPVRRVLQFVMQLPVYGAIGAVRIYQWTLSPILGGHCRFTPSCSHYAIDALRKYGFLRGSLKSIWRICRCNPFNPGGEDKA